MISSLWIAKTGLDAQQTNMDVIANNLANVSTNGFKRQRAVFEDLLYQTIRQPGAQSSEQTTLPSGLQIGTGVRPVATERLHSQGNLSQTNNSKDVAIKGQGFFQVMLPDGSSAYTRDGSFQVDQNGQLVTAGGFQVQPAITIPANALSITIGRDGVVSVTQQGQAAPVQVGQLNLTTFMNRLTDTKAPPGERNRETNRSLITGFRCNALTKSTVKRCPPPIRCCKN